jgi:hypothetical protein
MSPKKRFQGGRWHGPAKKKKKKIVPQQVKTNSGITTKTNVVEPVLTPQPIEDNVTAPRIEKMDEATTIKYRAIVADIRLIGILAAIAVALLITISFII